MNRRLGLTSWLLMCITLLGQRSMTAEETQPLSMSLDKFQELSAADQQALLAAVFQRRLDLANNVYVESTRWYTMYKYREGQIGEEDTKGTFRRFRHWRLDNSYRMDTDTHMERGVADPVQTVSSGFDAEKGVGRYTVKEPPSARGGGRIDTVHDPITESNRYAYWLDGEFPHPEDYLFRYLLGHQQEWDIDVPAEGDKVALSVPWQPWFSEEPLGERRLLLDPQKGFLPVEGHSRWDRTLGNGKPSWRVEDFVVEESQLVGDVWMPTKLGERVWASSVADKIAVYEIEATGFQFGTVTPDDLHVPFTEGMDVVDAVQGVGYVADGRGSPAGPVQPVMAAAPPESPDQEEASTSWRYGVTLISVGLFVSLIAWLWLRRGRRSAGRT